MNFPITARTCGESLPPIRRRAIRLGVDLRGIGQLDGSVVPCAAGGSLPFLQEDCMLVLRMIRECYPKTWGRYGFVDAFNPLTGWYNPDVLGIDLGITMLMAENARSGFVWNTFMKNKDPGRSMEKAGFKAGE